MIAVARCCCCCAIFHAIILRKMPSEQRFAYSFDGATVVAEMHKKILRNIQNEYGTRI